MAKRSNAIRMTHGDRVVSAICAFVLLLCAAVTFFPFMNVVSKAVSADWAVISGKVGMLPTGFHLDTLRYVAGSAVFTSAFRVSIVTTVGGTALAMVLTVLTAYALSKKHLPFIKFFLVAFVFTMLFSGGMVPNYMLMHSLGLLNSYAALLLPGALSVYNMLIIKSYFESLPESIEESAKLDGASNLVILFRILLPLSLPVLATIALFYAVGYWNDFINPLLYISKPALRTMQIYLRNIVLEASDLPDLAAARTMDDLMNVTPEGIRSAAVVAVTLPIVVVYPFLQKYFIKGILIGSVKG